MIKLNIGYSFEWIIKYTIGNIILVQSKGMILQYFLLLVFSHLPTNEKDF